MTDTEIEQEIQTKGLLAPRITPDMVQANIVGEYYFTGAHALSVDGRGNIPLKVANTTVCVLVLANGFSTTGINNGPVSDVNFDVTIARKLARQKAVDAIWPLMGYALQEKIHHG